MEKFIQIGQIKKPFGLKGELKVQIEEAYRPSFNKATVVFLKEGGNQTPYFVEYANRSGDALLKLEDIDSPELAKKLSKRDIFMRASDVEQEAPVLDANLEGFKIQDDTIGMVGAILEVVEYPQQLMALVAYKEQEVLIPLTEGLILGIDPEAQIILMDLPGGLLEL